METDTFQWTAADPTGAETPASAVVTITVDRPPLVTNYNLNNVSAPGQPVTFAFGFSGVFTEADPAATLTFSIDPASPPLHGTVSFDTVNQTYTYTADPAFIGNDTFNIKVTDSNGYTTLVFVNQNVTASGHDVPHAQDDLFLIQEGNSLSNITPSHYEVANDANIWSTGTFSYGAAPAHGTFTVNADGSYNYVPEPGPAGLGTFTVPFTWTDEYGQQASAVETIIVSSPTLSTAGVVKYAAVGASVPLNLDTQSVHSTVDPWVVGGPGVAAHLTYTVTTPPLHGTLVVDPANPLGGLIYTPNPGFSGGDSFTYSVFDGYNTVSATDTIVSDGRIFASPDSETTPFNTPYNGTVATISGSPAGGGGWTAQTQPAHGTAAVNPDGTYIYTPANGFSGLDKFSYKYTDSTGHTATNYVYILVPSAQTGPDVPPTSVAIPDQANHD